MKRKRSMKQRLAEISYKNPGLEKRINTIEKSFQEVKKLLNDKG